MIEIREEEGNLKFEFIFYSSSEILFEPDACNVVRKRVATLLKESGFGDFIQEKERENGQQHFINKFINKTYDRSFILRERQYIELAYSLPLNEIGEKRYLDFHKKIISFINDFENHQIKLRFSQTNL